MEAGRWISNITFAVLVSTSYILYALAFRDKGPLVWEFKYVLSVVLHPFFILGLILALGGSVVRLGLFQYMGISRTVIASELTIVFMLILSFLFFRERLTLQDMGGAVLILVGVWLVGR
ncbi:MAG: EamA family transporter [Chloroflexi bacterium]|nr:EamA family transporter [Chloroflexota bacterium]